MSLRNLNTGKPEYPENNDFLREQNTHHPNALSDTKFLHFAATKLHVRIGDGGCLEL